MRFPNGIGTSHRSGIPIFHVPRTKWTRRKTKTSDYGYLRERLQGFEPRPRLRTGKTIGTRKCDLREARDIFLQDNDFQTSGIERGISTINVLSSFFFRIKSRTVLKCPQELQAIPIATSTTESRKVESNENTVEDFCCTEAKKNQDSNATKQKRAQIQRAVLIPPLRASPPVGRWVCLRWQDISSSSSRRTMYSM